MIDRCSRQVNTKPWWMGNDQFDPCLCLLPKGHGGICLCDHTIDKFTKKVRVPKDH